MPRRPLACVGAELAGRITAIEIARAQLFDVDVDRKKRIDDAIDYFGAGPIDVAREGVRQLQRARSLPWLIGTSRRSRTISRAPVRRNNSRPQAESLLPRSLRATDRLKTTPYGRATRFRRACRVRPRAER
jgi:hypothetical protein